MPETALAPAKYKVLRDELLRAIKAGEFMAGERLPSERTLAEQFGVSHMTARRAVTDLVEFELLERRPPTGIFVRHQSREKLSTITLNLICPVQDYSWTGDCIRYGMQQAELRGWRTRIRRTYQDYERPIVRAVRAGEPALVLLDMGSISGPLREAMVKGGGRAVMVGNLYNDPCVPSVLADDRLAIRMSIEHLHAAGHDKIGIVANDFEHPVVASQLEAWRESHAGQVEPALLERRLIEVDVPEFSCGAEAHYSAVKLYLASPGADATALICLNDTAVLGAFGACRDMGLSVPDDISLICTMDNEVTRYVNPAITAIDVGVKNHVTNAMELIDAALAGTLCEKNRVRLVQPHLISRGSVCDLKKKV